MYRFLVVLILLAVPSTLHAQLATGSLRGHLLDNGRAIGDVVVSIPALGIAGVADAAGAWRLDGVPAGTWDIVLGVAGGRVVRAAVIAGRTTTLDVDLSTPPAASAPPPVPTLHGSATVIDSRLLRALPTDSVADVFRLVSGITHLPDGRVIRGGGPDRADVRVDGISMYRLASGRASSLRLPVHGISHVMVTTGPVPAWIGSTAAGAIEYESARAGGPWHTDVLLETEGLAPRQWRAQQHRASFFTGGTVPWLNGLTLSLAGDAFGSVGSGLPQLLNDLPVYVARGMDTTFVLPGGNGESVRVVVPRYERLSRSAAAPLVQQDGVAGSARLAWRRGGSTFAAAAHHSAGTGINRPLAELYNPDFWRGRHETATLLSLQARVPLRRPGFALNAQLSHQRDWLQTGMVTGESADRRLGAPAGFSLTTPGFFMDAGEWGVDEALIEQLRQGRARDEFLLPQHMRFAMYHRMQLHGMASPIRLNPYAMSSHWPIAGVPDTTAQSWGAERRWQLGTSLEWRPRDTHHGVLGVELTRAEARERTMWLFGGRPEASLHRPQLASVFGHYRLHAGAFSIDAGVRADRLDPDASLPVVPGTGGSQFAEWAVTAPRIAVSPRASAEYALNERFTARTSLSQTTRFAAVTGADGIAHNAHTFMWSAAPGTHFGRDIAPARARLLEFGVRGPAGRLLADFTVYRHTVSGEAVTVREWTTTPMHTEVWLNVLAPDTARSTHGVDVTLQRKLGQAGELHFNYGFADDKRGRGHTAGAVLTLDAGTVIGHSPHPVLAAALHGLTAVAVGSVSSGLPYTRLQNTGAGWIGPGGQSTEGTPAPEPSQARTPLLRQLDLRLARSFNVGRTQLTAFVDARNPLGLDQTTRVFLETGGVDHPMFRERTVLNYMWPDDLDLHVTTMGNPVADHMLRRAEQRFGNGDGIYTVEEQRRASEAWYELTYGQQWLRRADRTLRVGLELPF